MRIAYQGIPGSNSEAIAAVFALNLDIPSPQYLPAVPADPWSKDGKPLNYDAATGVVWSVGESGAFDYSKLPVEKSKRLRGKIGKYVDRFAFRLDGKPLNLMDNAK